jgi:hypothetical protein
MGADGVAVQIVYAAGRELPSSRYLDFFAQSPPKCDSGALRS